MADIVDPFDAAPSSGGIVDPFDTAAGTPQHDFSWSQAITDIPSEIGHEASSAASDIAALGNRSEQGPIEGLMTTGKAVAAVPRLLASPITGAARSLIGHPMANLEHAAGTLINPEVAAKDNPEQMYETAKGDVDTAMAAARPAGAPIKVGGAYEWNTPHAPQKPVGVAKQPDTDTFFDAADQNYSNMRGFGVEVKKSGLTNLADDIKRNRLEADGHEDFTDPKTYKALDLFDKRITGQSATISQIDGVRKVLGRIAKTDPVERDAARRAISGIDDYLAELHTTNLPDVAVNPHFAQRVADEAVTARGNFAVAKRSEDIDEALDKAQRQAASGGSGGNFNNAIRQQLKSLRNNAKKMMGWNDAEKAELDSVIEGSRFANATRKGGKLSPEGVVSAGFSAGLGHLIAPGVGEVAVPAAGWIMKKIADRATQQAAGRLSDVVKARSPLGKQTSINAAANAAFAPAKPKLLPTGVAAGISHPVHAAERLVVYRRPLTGSMPAAADQENPNGQGLRNNQPDQGVNGRAHGGRVSPKARAEKALPPNHKLGMRVPKGGSSCASCKYLASSTRCGNRGFIKWNKSAILPAPKDQYCCDLYIHSTKRAAGGAVFRAIKGYADGGAPDGIDDPAPQNAGVGATENPQISDNGAASNPSYWDRAKAMMTGSGPIKTSTGVTITPEDIEKGMNLGLSFSGGGLGTEEVMAAKNPIWRSQVEDTVAASPMKAAPAEQWAGTLKNAKGVKPEEMDWLGLNDYLASKAGQKVSKDDILQHIAGNKVELQDVVKGAPSDDLLVSSAGGPAATTPEPMRFPFSRREEAELELQRRWREHPNSYHNIATDIPDQTAVPKFSSYQLPGGENYREHLLTLPEKVVRSPRGEEETARLDAAANYRSSHWDEPNVLAHVRSNDRVMDSPDGPKKTLHLEEIQSDFMQTLRKEKQKVSAAVDNDFDGIADRMVKAGAIKKICD